MKYQCTTFFEELDDTDNNLMYSDLTNILNRVTQHSNSTGNKKINA